MLTAVATKCIDDVAMKDHADIIALWPNFQSFADDLAIKRNHGRVMKARASIPPEYWPVVVRAAEERGIPGISLEVLANLRRKPRGPATSKKRAA